MDFIRIAFGVAAVSLACGIAAQPYPNRPLRFVVPFAVAGSSDGAARLMAERFSALLGQVVVVENKAGAGGIVGTDYVAKSRPDGYTFVWAGSNAFAGGAKNMPFSPVNDFEPVCLVGTISYILTVSPTLGVKTVKELVDLAKSSSKPLAYASPGNGGGSHMSMEMLQHKAGINLLNVQYKGSAAAVTDVLAGHVPIVFETVSSVAQHVQTGKLIALATSSTKRLPGLPNVPTMKEAGYDFSVAGWAGLALPADTAPAIVARLDGACRTVLNQADAVDTINRKFGWEVEYLDPAAFGEFIKAQVTAWSEMTAISKIKE
ncbi:Bug family tripartite tricarboxylate transporter substrate binding protein [Ramlibacter henchirensis]|nr:tripartite tricarboxylate transporter substrate binding protein [Ramlibacter henchirensis]